MVNKAIIIGNLGADPELRTTDMGSNVANFNVATTERWKDQNGQNQESTEWHRIVAWNRLADICGQYLMKGSRVYIEGKIKTRKYTDQNGIEKYITEVVAREMKMLDSKGQPNETVAMAQDVFSQPKQQSFDEQGRPPHRSVGDDVPF